MIKEMDPKAQLLLIKVNHKLVLKLMQQMRLSAKIMKKKYNSYKGEIGKVAPNLLERDFSCISSINIIFIFIIRRGQNGFNLFLNIVLVRNNGQKLAPCIPKTHEYALALIVNMMAKSHYRYLGIDSINTFHLQTESYRLECLFGRNFLHNLF